VVNQTLRNIEIICINDCTSDNSQKILNDYANDDKRIILLQHEKNLGLAAARNTGLETAKGNYIFFLDSDDFFACNDALESLYLRAAEDHADETIGGVLKWNEKTGEKFLDWHQYYLEKEVRGKPLTRIPQLWSNVVAWNKLLLRSFLNNNGIRFNDTIRKHEDNPFSIQIHILAKRISIITKTTYIYRQVENGSIMSTISKTDPQYRCEFCYDIFKFIESDQNRYRYRKIFYPMYSMQLIESAKILSCFMPTESEKTVILNKWKKIAYLLPENLLEIPMQVNEIFNCLKNDEMQLAWKKAIDFDGNTVKNNSTAYKKESHKNSTNMQAEIIELKKLKNILTKQIAAVYNTKSWRITKPLRWFSKKFKRI
jgi:glycosyltransferase involved in cell wall biosynthesis